MNSQVHGFRCNLDVFSLGDALEHFRGDEATGAPPLLGVRPITAWWLADVACDLHIHFELELQPDVVARISVERSCSASLRNSAREFIFARPTTARGTALDAADHCAIFLPSSPACLTLAI